MSFTFLARVVSIITVILGLLAFAMSLWLAEQPELQAKYFGTSSTNGERMDQSLRFIFMGLGLGVLADISRSVRRVGEEKAIGRGQD